MQRKLIETRHTAETGVKVWHIAPGFWQHADCNGKEPRAVGPHYKTKAECLADHERYMVAGGWILA